MRARALDGHYRALRAVDEDRPLLRPDAHLSEVRGMRTILATLRRWEAIEGGREPPGRCGAWRLTDVGRELLADRVCPDGGTCHHSCTRPTCFRVEHCGPLSGVFPGDEWPEGVR
jgi:hypothetical protein